MLSNTIWSLKDVEGRVITDFRGSEMLGRANFEKKINAPREATFAEII